MGLSRVTPPRGDHRQRGSAFLKQIVTLVQRQNLIMKEKPTKETGPGSLLWLKTRGSDKPLSCFAGKMYQKTLEVKNKILPPTELNNEKCIICLRS